MNIGSAISKSINNNALTALKIFGIIAMVIDHYNKFANPNYSEIMFNIGRTALPIFAFVIAFNLSRMDVSRIPAMIFRLVVFGVISIPAYTAMGGTISMGWWPLNILFTLAASAGVVYFAKKPGGSDFSRGLYKLIAFIIFIVAGASVEFFWPAIALVFFLSKIFEDKNRRHSINVFAITSVALSLYFIGTINGNWWHVASLLIIPLILYSKNWIPKLPRMKFAFYSFYPAHLLFIWAITQIR